MAGSNPAQLHPVLASEHASSLVRYYHVESIVEYPVVRSTAFFDHLLIEMYMDLLSCSYIPDPLAAAYSCVASNGLTQIPLPHCHACDVRERCTACRFKATRFT